MESSRLSRLCANCGKPASLLCGRCRLIVFCDERCQRAAWGRHKPLCEPAGTIENAMVVVVKKTLGPPPDVPTASMSIARIIAILKAHPRDARIMERGIRILISKGEPKKGKEALIVSSGAVALFVSALCDHAANATICAEASSAINIITCQTSVKKAAVAAGAIAPLRAALCTHATDGAVCKWVCAAIADIAVLPEGKEAAIKASVIAPTVAALRTHAGSEIVCRAASCVINNLGMAGARAAVDAGAVAALIAALVAHTNGADLCHFAIGALHNIANLCIAEKEAIVIAGAVTPIVAALKKHGIEKCRYAYFALHALGFTDDGEKRI